MQNLSRWPVHLGADSLFLCGVSMASVIFHLVFVDRDIDCL
jgi:hypothetical protein